MQTEGSWWISAGKKVLDFFCFRFSQRILTQKNVFFLIPLFLGLWRLIPADRRIDGYIYNLYQNMTGVGRVDSAKVTKVKRKTKFNGGNAFQSYSFFCRPAGLRIVCPLASFPPDAEDLSPLSLSPNREGVRGRFPSHTPGVVSLSRDSCGHNSLPPDHLRHPHSCLGVPKHSFDDPFRLLSWLFFKIFKMKTIF